MLTNLNTVFSSIRKETEKLRDNLIESTNNLNWQLPTAATNSAQSLSSILKNSLFLHDKNGNPKKRTGRADPSQSQLLRKRLEACDFTVDTRRNSNTFPSKGQSTLQFEDPILHQFKDKNFYKRPDRKNCVSLNNRNQNLQNLQKIQQQESDVRNRICLAEEISRAEKAEAEALGIREIVNHNESLEELRSAYRNSFRRRATNPSMQREVIRKRLADGDSWRNTSSGQLSLNSRFSAIGAGQNLQVCFMNETAGSEGEDEDPEPQSLPCFNIGPGKSTDLLFDFDDEQEPQDFFQKQAKLLGEAKQALSQAKEIAKLQIKQEKALRPISPVSEMIGSSTSKVKGRKPEVKGRLTPALLKQFTSAQLQLILNDLHSHVEKLNEDLVSMLVERDDLHMEQDSMLVDVDDLTRYIAAKHNSPHQSLPLINVSQTILGRKK